MANKCMHYTSGCPNCEGHDCPRIAGADGLCGRCSMWQAKFTKREAEILGRVAANLSGVTKAEEKQQ